MCTANTLNIPAPLLDRMEVIRIPGYTEDEKLHIAERYLIPKQMKENGLQENELSMSSTAVLDIIQHYTRESGVRNLEREISKICRKVVKSLLLKPRQKMTGLHRRAWYIFSAFDASDTARPKRTTRSDRSRDSHGPRSAANC